MKRFKKMMAIVIALVMTMMYVVPMTAFADETSTSVPSPTSKGSGAFTITMQSAEDGHTFKAYRIFDGSVATLDGSVKLGDISWATGFNTGERQVGSPAVAQTLAQELAGAGLATTIDGAALDLSKAADVAKALSKQSDDSDTMKKVADIFYARKGDVVATTAAKTGEDYILGNGASGSANAPLVAGYYLVTDEYTNASSVPAGAETLSRNVLEVVGNVTANVKNDQPTVEKKILTPTAKDANVAGIGDTVAFQITGKVPNYEGYDKYFYVINDTLSTGLTFDGAQNVVVKVGDTTLTQSTDYLVLTSSTTPAASDGHTFEIAFKKIKDYTIGTNITVTYTATVNNNAAIGGTGNKNETDVTYSNNPNNSSGGNPSENPKPTSDIPTGDSAKDVTVTYVAELDLTKYKDQSGAGHELAGATFTLTGNSTVVQGTGSDIYVEDAAGAYWKLTDNTYTTTAPHGDIKDADNKVVVTSNESSYASTTKKYKLQHVTGYVSNTEVIFMQGTSGNDGKITFSGLGEGTYTLTEVVAPSGYNVADPLTLQITVTLPETISTGSETATFTIGTASTAGKFTLKNGTASTGVYETGVIDNSGTVLPSTGGMGTTLFYLFGAILVIGAGVILVTRKRVESQE